jgi:mannose-6-phosphate isomerase-like protein (cupin superfamily)
MPAPIRRVVTGKDATGKAIVMMDSAAANVRERKDTGIANTLLWVTDTMPAVVTQPNDAAERKIGVHPPPHGTVFRVVEFPPGKDVRGDYESRLCLMREMGLAPEGPCREHPRDPGMHRTLTLDYAVIMSGEIDMLLDDAEVHLKAGDVVIQQGTNHAWVNRGGEPCQIAFVLIDGKD